MKGQNIPEPGIPESFKVLIKELQSLGLDFKCLDRNMEEIDLRDSFEDDDDDIYEARFRARAKDGADMESMFDDDFDGEDALSEEDEDKEGDANLFDDWIDDGEEEEADTDLFGGDDDDNDENDEFALFEE